MTDGRMTEKRPAALGAEGASWTRGLERALRAVMRWLHRARTRGELAELDARQRADLGVRWEDARAEVRKPFWRH